MREASTIISLLIGAAVLPQPAFAAEPGDVPQGDLLVIRDVGPRNAINPTNGQPHTVRIAPDFPFSAALRDSLTPISDGAAAEITSGHGAGSIRGVLDPLFAQQFGPTSGEPAGRISGGGAGSISGTVSGALGSGLGAMRGALGCVKGC